MHTNFFRTSSALPATLTGLTNAQVPTNAVVFFNAEHPAENEGQFLFACYPASAQNLAVRKVIILQPGQSLPKDIKWSDPNCLWIGGVKYCFHVEVI